MMDTAALGCVCMCGGASIMGSGDEAALMGEAYKRDGGW